MADHFPLSLPKLILVTFSLSLGIFMNVLDVSIANVAIPSIAGELAVSPSQGTWVITSFAVSQAIMLPITGWLARRFGEIRLYVLSTLLFTIASVFCGLSINLPMLVIFRVIQGAVSGPMIPLSQSILLSMYPEERKGFATAIWSMTAVVGPVCGPILGGLITDNFSWPWIFYINLPVGIFSALMTGYLLTGRETPIQKSPIDIIGLLLLSIGIGSLQILLDNGHDLDWFNSNVIISLGIISFIALTYLIVWEVTEPYPIIDLKLFARRNFFFGTLILTLGYMTFFGNVVIFPLWLQTQMGYTPTWSGLAAAPIGIMPFFFTPLIGLYLHKVDLRITVAVGFIIFALTSFWSSHFDTSINFAHLIEPRFVQGLGIACFFTPLISIILSGLPQHRVASALGLANFCRILGSSFGTSLSVNLWDRREAFHHSRLVENINLYNPNNIATIQQLKSIGFGNQQSYAVIAQMITHQAYMLATNDIFWLSGILFLCLLMLIWLTKPPFAAIKSGESAH